MPRFDHPILIAEGIVLSITDRGLELAQINADVQQLPRRHVERVVEALRSAAKGH